MTKILVAYHKEAQIVKDDVFVPIHTGAALAGNTAWSKDILRDDAGDNISVKNPTYNELTAVYYAWKHYSELGNPDRIGLCHYRRFFIFEERKYAYYEQRDTGEHILQDIKAENLDPLLSSCDFVAPMPNVRKSVYDNYCSAHHKDDIDLALDIVARLFPNIKPAADKYAHGKAAFFYNMFILSRQDFFDYCEFIFGVLEEYEKLTAHRDERFFISEVLTGVFFVYLMGNGKKPLFLPVLYIGGKPSFKQSIAMCKANFKGNTSGFLFKIKPLIVYFIPNSLLLRRKRKTTSIK